MATIRNDRRPTTPTPPSTPSMPMPATGPADLSGTSGVDDDLDAASVTDIEKLEGKSLEDGLSLGAPAASTTTVKPGAMPGHNPEAIAKVADEAAVTKLINDAAKDLKPGESVTLGGKASGGEVVVAEAGLEVSVTKRADGKLEVKTKEEAAVGLGVKFGVGGRDAEVAGKLGLAREVTFVVATGAEAATLMAEFAAAKAAQAQPMLGVVAEKVYDYATKDQVAERKYALTFEAEGEIATGAAELGLKLGDGAALVESPPGTWFVEFEGEFEGEAVSDVDVNTLDGLGGKANARATIRVPIAAPDLDVGTPQGMLKHAQGAMARLKEAEVTIEVRGDAGRSAVGSRNVIATKTFKAGDLPGAAKMSTGWNVRGELVIGPREASDSIGPGEVEVTANRTVIMYQSTSGSLENQMKKANEAVAQAEQVKQRTGGR